MAAAVTAARAGGSVVLAERHGALGGMATAALVHSICGLYRIREEPGAVHAHCGFPREFSDRLISAGASHGPVRMGRLDVLPHSPAGFAVVADQLTAACAGLDVRLHAELTGVSHEDGTVRSVDIVSRGRSETIEPVTVVDASGDAVLAALADAECGMEEPARLQRPAFIFSFHSVDASALDDQGRISLAAMIADAVRCGRLAQGALGAQFRVTGRGSEVFVTVDLAATPDYDPTHPAQLAALEREGRAIAAELRQFLRSEHKAFQGAEYGAFPSRVGIRESRRIRGAATVTAGDVLNGTPCRDVVALGTWPVELREKATGPRWKFPDGNRPTQIPLGALRPAGLSNVWTAGRCISCDHEAQASLRVIATCMATGQAAGTAAAIQARGTKPTADAVRATIGMEPPA